jgi:S1-C subfamily serine protease
VIVTSVDPNSGADKAGIQPAQSSNGDPTGGGDVITKVDGKDVNGIEQLRSAVSGKKPGDKVTLTILHGGQTKDVQVTLGSPPTVLASDENGGPGSPQIP